MKISILCVGRIKEKYWNDAIAEYTKRLSRYCSLEIIEVHISEKTGLQNGKANAGISVISAEKNAVGFHLLIAIVFVGKTHFGYLA